MVNDVQKLRQETGAGVMECKRALEDANGDFEKAISLVKERGFTKAGAKASRATGTGYLETYVHNGRVGVLLELRCETDFVAKSDPFKKLARDIVMQIAAMRPETVEILQDQPYIKDESLTVGDIVKNMIAITGENIQIARFTRYEV
jgi:elongation factor Ts